MQSVCLSLIKRSRRNCNGPCDRRLIRVSNQETGLLRELVAPSQLVKTRLNQTPEYFQQSFIVIFPLRNALREGPEYLLHQPEALFDLHWINSSYHPGFDYTFQPAYQRFSRYLFSFFGTV